MISKDFFGALLLGAGIGVAVGVLLAPEKGNETIKKLSDGIKDKYKKFKGDAENISDNIQREGKHLLDKGSNMAKTFVNESEKKADNLKGKFNQASL